MQSKSLAQSEAGLLERQIAEAGEAGAQLEEQKSILAGIEERLAKKEFALAEQEATQRLERQMAALGYDAAYHEAVRTELAELGTSEAPKRRLEEAERLIVRERSLRGAGRAGSRGITGEPGGAQPEEGRLDAGTGGVAGPHRQAVTD